MHNIPEVLLNEILQYLGNRPFIEVVGLIQKIGKAVLDSIKSVKEGNSGDNKA